MAVVNPPTTHPKSANHKYLSIQKARDFIKINFAIHRQLLDKKELELLTELNQLEENNKQELIHVNADIKQLSATIETIEESLGANSLKIFLEQQKSIWSKQIFDLTKYQEFLTHVNLDCSEYNSFENIIQIIPFWPKSKFRTELEPILNCKPQINEEWFVVSKKWFSEFANSINPNDPVPNNRWEFPASIPIDQSGIYINGQIQNPNDCEVLHSKAWDLLLRYNGLSPGSVPIIRRTYTNNHLIVVPIATTRHQCFIGHHSAGQKFNISCQLEMFPYDAYQDLLHRISGFSTLFTTHDPILYFEDSLYAISCNPEVTQYNFQLSHSSRSVRPLKNVTSLNSLIGNRSKVFLVIIPDFSGKSNIRVVIS